MQTTTIAFAAGLEAVASKTGADVVALDHLFQHGFFDPDIPMQPSVRLQFKELRYLDLSFGQLTTLSPLRWFPNLDTLVADQNRFRSLATCPELASLTTLSLNNNDLEDLTLLLSDAASKFPALVFLSLIGNPCSPEDALFAADDGAAALQPQGGDSNCVDTYEYRMQVWDALPQLRFLDSKALSNDKPDVASDGDDGGGGGDDGGWFGESSSDRGSWWGGGDADARGSDGAGGGEVERLSEGLSHGGGGGGGDTGGGAMADPLFALAEVKLHAGVISEAEYVKIMTVHRAVSVSIATVQNSIPAEQHPCRTASLQQIMPELLLGGREGGVYVARTPCRCYVALHCECSVQPDVSHL